MKVVRSTLVLLVITPVVAVMLVLGFADGLNAQAVSIELLDERLTLTPGEDQV